MDSLDPKDEESEYSRPPQSLKSSTGKFTNQALEQQKYGSNNRQTKFSNFNDEIDQSDIFEDSVEERDTIQADLKFSPLKYGGGSRINSNYTTGGEKSELVEEEEFQISQGTKEKNEIFKNNLYKTGKSNRYRGYGDVSESGVSDEMGQKLNSELSMPQSLMESQQSKVQNQQVQKSVDNSGYHYGYDDSEEF